MNTALTQPSQAASVRVNQPALYANPNVPLLIASARPGIRVNQPPARQYRRSAPAAAPAALPVRRPDLTTFERLLRDSDNISGAASKACEGEGHFYEVRGYDRQHNTVYIQRGDIEANTVYAINRRAMTCSCPQFTERIARVNLRREEAGLCASLVCKHIQILNLRENEIGFDALLETFARAWEWTGEASVLLAVERAFDTDAPANECVQAASYSEQMERDFD